VGLAFDTSGRGVSFSRLDQSAFGQALSRFIYSYIPFFPSFSLGFGSLLCFLAFTESLLPKFYLCSRTSFLCFHGGDLARFFEMAEQKTLALYLSSRLIELYCRLEALVHANIKK